MIFENRIRLLAPTPYHENRQALDFPLPLLGGLPFVMVEKFSTTYQQDYEQLILWNHFALKTLLVAKPYITWGNFTGMPLVWIFRTSSYFLIAIHILVTGNWSVLKNRKKITDTFFILSAIAENTEFYQDQSLQTELCTCIGFIRIFHTYNFVLKDKLFVAFELSYVLILIFFILKLYFT